MKYVSPGLVPNDKFEIIIKLARIRSDSVIEALRDYCVKGMKKSLCADLNGVERPNFTTSLKSFERTFELVEMANEVDRRHA